jgi:hypothetical protein
MSTKTNGNAGARYWWIQVLRGSFALGLGLSLLGSLIGISLLKENYATTDKILIFIGMFWLTTGLMSYIWGSKVADDPGYWWIIAMIISFGGGLFVIFRTLIGSYVGVQEARYIVALLFFLNGSMHVMDINKNPEDDPKLRIMITPVSLSFILGMTEVMMAIILAFFWGVSSLIDTLVSILAILWSGISGIGLLYRGFKLKNYGSFKSLTNEKEPKNSWK